MKEGLQLMRKIEMTEMERDLAYFDSLLIIREKDAENLIPQYIFQKDEKYDDIGKYICKQQILERNLQRSYIRSGVTELGEMYIASVYYGKGAIKHTHLKVSLPNGDYKETAVVPADGAINYSFVDDGMTTEVITYQNGRDNGVISFICENPDAKIKAEYLGGKKYTLFISEADKQSIVKIDELATVLSDIQKIKKEMNRMRGRLEYLTDKLENTAVPDSLQ